MKSELIAEPVKLSVKYKQTEVGLIPKDWEVKIVGQLLLANPDYGINAASIPFNYSFPTYLRITDISDRGTFIQNQKSSVSHVLANNYFLKQGDIVFARTGASVGKTYLYDLNDGPLVFAGFLIRCRPNNKLLNSKFLKYFTQSKYYWDWLLSNSMRSGQPGINSIQLKSLALPLPPIEEQTAIAEALSDTDALIASLEKLIEKKKNIKQGVMQELLKPTDLDGKQRKGWVKKKLGEIAEIVMGQSPLSVYYNTNGIGLPLVQGNADILERKTIVRNYTSVIAKSGKKGDIIMSVRAPVGEISIATFDCCLGRGVCAIRYRNDYLYHYMLSIENSWNKISTGSTFDSVTSLQVKDLDILIPSSEDEQIKIANVLTEMDNAILLMNNKLHKTIQIKQGMMQNLLTGKVRLI